MVYKITLIPISKRFGPGKQDCAVVVSIASDSLPFDVDFSSHLSARRMLLDFLRVCGFRLSEYLISAVDRYDV